MANEYARLLIELEANTRKFTGPMNQAAGQVSSFMSGLKKAVGMLGGAFAVGSVVNFAKKVAGAADAQNKLARRLGITKSEVDALELSFTKGGQSIQEAEKSLDIFNRRVGELEAGEVTVLDTFQRLGINVEKFLEQSYVDRLVTIKKSLDGMTTSARAFAQQELFGRGGAKIYEGLVGLEETDKLIKKINKSLGITDQGVGSIEEMNDAWTETKKILELVTTSVLVKLSPELKNATEGAGKLLLNLNKIAEFRLAAGAASEMAGGGIKGWWASMQLAPNEVEETLAQWESYKAKIEMGRQSARGGALPTVLTQINARKEHEALKKSIEAETSALKNNTEGIVNSDDKISKFIEKVKADAIPAIDVLRESYNMLSNAADNLQITETEKISGMATAWKEYKDAVGDLAGDGTLVELQLQMERLQSLFDSGQIDKIPFEDQMQRLKEMYNAQSEYLKGTESFVEYLKNMFSGLTQNQEAMDQFNQDFGSFAEQVMTETQSPFEKWIEHIWKLDKVLEAGMITWDAYWKSAANAYNKFMESSGVMDFMQQPPAMFRMNQDVPSSGMQIMDISSSRFQAPGVASSFSASQIAGVLSGGNLENINKQQLTAQRQSNMYLQNMNTILARGLI